MAACPSKLLSSALANGPVLSPWSSDSAIRDLVDGLFGPMHEIVIKKLCVFVQTCSQVTDTSPKDQPV